MAELVVAGSAASGKTKWSVLLGAVFLMVTSAIGPGFLTQTAVFTEKFGASFAFAILISILIDIGAQLNVWRVITMSRMRGQDVANAVLPGLGHGIAILVVLGGLAFNIGNVAGAGLALNVLFDISIESGAIISGVVAFGIFASRQAGVAMDAVVKVLGVVMIVLASYVMFSHRPPVELVVARALFPENYGNLMLPMITLVGGTVGGYITFAGGHRLLDAGVVGEENLDEVNKAGITGILVTGVMRVVIFLAALGVVAAGAKLAAGNPSASVFRHAAGEVGYKLFGIVLWAAAITSIVGAAYTSVSFLRSMSTTVDRNNVRAIMVFIAVSTVVSILVGRTVTVLILVGALNGLILPITLGTMLVAARNRTIVGDYRHPTWLVIYGVIAAVAAACVGAYSLRAMAALWA
jgi:Mn2+/Fe2+ NRAMP family transporter